VSPHAEIPTQKKIKKSFDADDVLFKAAKILNCDPRHYRKALRISAADKVNRDLLIYLLWHTGQLTNQRIGEKFGLSYSAVSGRVRIFKELLKNNRELEDTFNQIKSLIKI
jgi:chromosomal replication initiation ATPase DnaA